MVFGSALHEAAEGAGVSLLGLDLGSTWFKIVQLSEDGEGHRARVPTPWRGVEIDLDDALTAVTDLLRGLDRRRRPDVVLGVTGMGDTGFLLDEAGEPVGPALGWLDSRGELAPLRGLEAYSGLTGLPLTPLCGAAKYAWMRRHWKGTERGRWWAGLPDAVVHALTGTLVAEPTLATRSGFLALDGGPAWAVLDAVGAPSDLLPPRRPAGAAESLLSLSDHWHARLRSTGTVRVMAAGHDAVAAATAFSDHGEIMDVTGTAETVVRVVPAGTVAVEDAIDAGLSLGHHHGPANQVLQTAHPESGRLLQTADPAARRGLDEWLAATIGLIEQVSGPSERLVLGGGFAGPLERARRETLLGRRVGLAPDQQVSSLGAAHLAGHALAATAELESAPTTCCRLRARRAPAG